MKAVKTKIIRPISIICEDFNEYEWFVNVLAKYELPAGTVYFNIKKL